MSAQAAHDKGIPLIIDNTFGMGGEHSSFGSEGMGILTQWSQVTSRDQLIWVPILLVCAIRRSSRCRC